MCSFMRCTVPVHWTPLQFPGFLRFVMDRAAESGDDLKLESHMLKLMSSEGEMGEQMRRAAAGAEPVPEAGKPSEPTPVPTPVPPSKMEL